jgi:hypothetical protein
MVLPVTGKAIPVPACKGLVRPLELQEDEACRIDRQLAHVGGNIVSPMHQLLLPPRRDTWCSFLLEVGRIRSMKNPIAPMGMEPTTFGIVVQCLNQLHHVLPVLLVPQIIQPPQFVVLEKCSFMFHFISLLTDNYNTRSCCLP